MCTLCTPAHCSYTMCFMATIEIMDALCASVFSALAGAFYGGLCQFYQEARFSLFFKKCHRTPLLRPAHRNTFQCSLFQWLSERIKRNFINKGRNRFILYCERRPSHVRISSLFSHLVSGLAARHIFLAPEPVGDSFKRSGPVPLNIRFLQGRIRQSVSGLKEKLVLPVTSTRTVRS